MKEVQNAEIEGARRSKARCRTDSARHPGGSGGGGINPGGLAAVWAESNTREAIFDAIRRRETFATSGTRLRLRFFAGFAFPDDLTQRADALELAYAEGSPMGGDLSGSSAHDAPRFWLWATRAVDGAPLDRLQVIKGWTDADGAPQERVWDVACAGGREPDPGSGRCPATTAAVDLGDCSINPEAGATELQLLWSDPEFDPSRRAFYYLRALENPTCRWTTRLALRDGIDPPPDQPATIQERAWSSPIWYAPGN